MRSHIDCGGERNILYKGVETSKKCVLILSPKRTIFATDGLVPLQMVSKPDTRRCASEEAKPRRGWLRGGVPARTLGPKRGGLRGLTSIEEGNECQQGCWAMKGGGL